MLRVRVVGEKLRRILPLRFRFELFEKLRQGARVVARIIEDLSAHHVGLRFSRSRIAQEHTAGRETAQFRQERAAGGVSENCAEDSQTRLGQHRLGCLVGAMAQGHMRQLVRDHSSELRLIVRCFDRSAVHKHVSAGQSKSIDGFVVHAMKFEGILHSTCRQLLRQPRAKLRQVGINPRCVARRQQLFSIRGCSLAEAYVVLRRKLVPTLFELRSLRRCVRN